MNELKNQIFQAALSLKIKDRLYDLSKPLVMGILNITPDSFYDGGQYEQATTIIQQCHKMLEEGADIIDIGAYSSRPGADAISQELELERLIPAIQLIIREFPEVNLSIDTFRSEVARQAVDQGVSMINDISGGNLDDKMFETVASLKVPYVLMHMKGNPQNMATQNNYEDILLEMLAYFEKKVYKLQALGVKDIIIDPGFGFAKNIAQNYFLLNHLAYFQILNRPVLVGISRKSLIYKTLHQSPQEALNGTSVLNTVALLQSASILRVHDVREAREAIRLVAQLGS